MRIWSKKLIPILPTKQLKAMRYELGDVIKQYPNIKHSLVKFANDYDIAYLGEYFREVILECKNRNVNMQEKYNSEIIDIVLKHSKKTFEEYPDYFGNYVTTWDYLKFDEDNKEYLNICYWNLYEKHLRKMITDEEWQKIEDLIGKEV